MSLPTRSGPGWSGRIPSPPRCARHAAHFGLRRGDGVALLGWLLDLTGDPDAPRWIHQAEQRPAPDSRPVQAGGRGLAIR